MTNDQLNPDGDHVADGPPGLPRWVKLLALGAAIATLVLLVAIVLIGGDHGPARHGG